MWNLNDPRHWAPAFALGPENPCCSQVPVLCLVPSSLHVGHHLPASPAFFPGSAVPSDFLGSQAVRGVGSTLRRTGSRSLREKLLESRKVGFLGKGAEREVQLLHTMGALQLQVSTSLPFLPKRLPGASFSQGHPDLVRSIGVQHWHLICSPADSSQ
jgi:hypothetical protein